ncbi:hypothetical protein PybrP1_009732 [[Pythium] brassicae (nom. inval.)]|nr:hypothetical protein PybrP1_009732 [[Pythium] brassicae (nom. inval.)]
MKRKAHDSNDDTNAAVAVAASSPVPPLPLLPRNAKPRKLIGAYEQLQEIGRGTYGSVYAGVKRASDGTAAERVAIKKVFGRAAAAQREAALLRRCRGAQHVVQVLDVVEHRDKLYLVLEYMESDLEAVIRAREQIPTLGVARNGWEAAAAALPFFLRFKDTRPPPLKAQLPAELSDAGVALLRAMLQLDPAKRISVDDALAHAFFEEAPLPADPAELEIPDDPRRALPAGALEPGPPDASVAAAAVVVENERTVMIKGRRLL